jgi:Ca-activated chloride channel family protein
MGGEKLQYTKEAVKLLITHLAPDDMLGIVTFDSSVDVVLEPTKVTDKDELKQLVDEIDVGGCTNLSGGWLKGIELSKRAADGNRLNRILLLTDGLANEGITELASLVALGQSAYKKNNTVTTALGFGHDFDEDMLTAIATGAGGKFYYIDTPDAAPAVFKEELEGLLSLVAQNIELTVTIQDPVCLAKQWTGYSVKVNDNAATFNLGDAYSNEEKRVLLTLGVPNMKELGECTIANVRLQYSELSDASIKTHELKFPVMVNVSDAEAAKAAGICEEVIEELALKTVAETRRKAIEKADSGDYEGAHYMMDDSVEYLASLPLKDKSRIQSELEDLKHEAVQMSCAESYTSEARKGVASNAYNLSTSQYDKLARERQRRDGTD